MDTLTERWKAIRWTVPEDFLTREHFERVVRELDWTSSPGYPWLLQHTTNAAMFEVKDGEPSKAAVDRVWQVVSDRLRTREVDPVRLFIKPEPHKLKKLNAKAYRLISSVSVIDQLLDALLFGEMNQKMIEQHLMVPGKVGWTPYVGGWKIMPARLNRSLDKSAWDWSVNGWIAEMLLQFRKELMDRNQHSQAWEELAEWRYRALFESPVFVTSGGLYLRQREPGVIKSGCYNTIADNSVAQDLLHVRVCHEMDIEPEDLMSMGDDTTQREFPEWDAYCERLAQYCHIKGDVKATEFAGHRFTSLTVEPLYKGKHAFNILNMNPKYGEETAASYALLYHRSVHRDYIRGVLQRMGYRIPSLTTLDVIYDGEL